MRDDSANALTDLTVAAGLPELQSYPDLHSLLSLPLVSQDNPPPHPSAAISTTVCIFDRLCQKVRFSPGVKRKGVPNKKTAMRTASS